MSRILKFALPIGVLAAAAMATAAMISVAPKARRSPPPDAPPTVEIVEVHPGNMPSRITATGLVTPAREVSLTPEVSGRIVWTHDDLRPGLKLRAGQIFARIDPRDYELALDQEFQRTRQAEVELALERGRQTVAEREWALLGDPEGGGGSDLTLRRPQLASAEQALAAAKSGVERARLALERTGLRAPFDAMVTEEHIDRGQVVSPGTPVATLVGTAQMRVDVSVPVEALAALQLPTEETPGSPVTVVQKLGRETPLVRTGVVLGLGGTLDPQTRRATILIGVDDPLDTSDGGLPLLPGAFVEATIHGRTMPNVYSIPREAVFEGDQVWTVVEGSLKRRTLTIAWRDRDVLYTTDGLSPGDRVVVTPMSLPVDGMRVQVAAPSDTAPSREEASR